MPEVLEGRRLAGEVAGRAVRAYRVRQALGRVIDAAESQVDPAKVLDRPPFAVSADVAPDVPRLRTALLGRIQVTQIEMHLAEVVQRDRPQGQHVRRPQQVRGKLQVLHGFLARATHFEVPLAEPDRALRLSPRVAELAPDGQGLLEVTERFLVPQPGQSP